ncbi:hypothetical protein LUZ63_009198 [Rhynchospora breviuscula]|uniref:Uncharacterized protein n=1 Tax=Rhynchospora breviuscula TaxID=2022672 RepID=A0A9Q0CEQ1_9POAL|nr:hypothetical protein LUZ63_009198 [Rhynchospora breviuscula]
MLLALAMPKPLTSFPNSQFPSQLILSLSLSLFNCHYKFPRNLSHLGFLSLDFLRLFVLWTLAMALPPEIDKYAKDLIQSYLLQEQALAFSPEKLQLKLSASENACHLLKEQVFELESRLKKITTQIEQRKAEAEMNSKALMKCMEDKAGLVVSCKRLASLCDELERKCSSCDHDLSRYMESLEENKRENEELTAISQQEQLSEEAKRKAEIEALEKDKIGQAMNLVKAEQEVGSLSLENRHLEHKHDKLLVPMERFEVRNLLFYFHPLKLLKTQSDWVNLNLPQQKSCFFFFFFPFPLVSILVTSNC